MQNLRIGNIELDGCLVLAPMAGVTDHAYRIICHGQGASLVCTEMVSAKALHYRNAHTDAMTLTTPEEGPVSLQLFGSEPDVLNEVAKSLNDKPFDILDFNMGCPVPKVVKNGEGSALMLDEGLARECMAALVEGSSKPVTVKMRAGFDAEHINAPRLAAIAEECGVAGVCVHGRTRSQYYAGHADWSVIARVKEAVSIPVIGNGDLRFAADVLRMAEETGCDGFAIGRACEGDPWVFARIRRALETGEDAQRPEPEEIFAMLLRHARMSVEAYGEEVGIKHMRKHAAWYTAGLPHSAAFRREIMRTTTYAELEALVNRG